MFAGDARIINDYIFYFVPIPLIDITDVVVLKVSDERNFFVVKQRIHLTEIVSSYLNRL